MFIYWAPTTLATTVVYLKVYGLHPLQLFGMACVVLDIVGENNIACEEVYFKF
jgi:hypothetical protein